VEPEPHFGMMMSELPSEVNAENNYRLVAEVPLLRYDAGDDRVSFAEIWDPHIGPEAGCYEQSQYRRN
jgi:hypothetical protein